MFCYRPLFSTRRATAVKWNMLATMTRVWKISWYPNVLGKGLGLFIAYTMAARTTAEAQPSWLASNKHAVTLSQDGCILWQKLLSYKSDQQGAMQRQKHRQN